MKTQSDRIGYPEDLKIALITGATGTVGYAITKALAQNGWKMGIQYQKNKSKAEELISILKASGTEAVALRGDLALKDTAAELVESMKKTVGAPFLLVHAASPQATTSSFLNRPDDLEKMFQVNVAAFFSLFAAILPDMLRTQTGTVIAILSEAITAPLIPNWQSYTVSKSALAQAVNEIDASYRDAGIRAFSLLLGAVRESTPKENGVPASHRQAIRKRWPMGLAPSQIGEAIIKIINDSTIPSGTALSISGKNEFRKGRFIGWVEEKNDSAVLASEKVEKPSESGIELELRKMICRMFGVAPSYPVEKASAGNLDGWDSLGHMRLIMEIESLFGITFTSEEASILTSFQGIAEAIARHRKNGNTHSYETRAHLGV